MSALIWLYKCVFNKCTDIKSNTKIIPWVSEAIYLGLYVTTDTHFLCNFPYENLDFTGLKRNISNKMKRQPNPMATVIIIGSIFFRFGYGEQSRI